MYAAEYNKNPEVVSILLNAGADVNAKDAFNYTALIYAAALNENPEVISILLKAGADINAKNIYYSKTALMFAAEYNKNPEVISLLLKAGADINAKNKDGKTALDLARKEKNTDAIELLEKAFNASAQSGNPETQYQLALKYAAGDGVKQDDKKAVELLRKAAAQGHQKAKEALALYE